MHGKNEGNQDNMYSPCKVIEADVVDPRDFGKRLGLLGVVEQNSVLGGNGVQQPIW